MKMTLIIAGRLASTLANSVNATKKGLDSLGTTGTETQEKLKAIGNISSNQLSLQAAV